MPEKDCLTDQQPLLSMLQPARALLVFQKRKSYSKQLMQEQRNHHHPSSELTKQKQFSASPLIIFQHKRQIKILGSIRLLKIVRSLTGLTDFFCR
jgi:hypothetical protein